MLLLLLRDSGAFIFRNFAYLETRDSIDLRRMGRTTLLFSTAHLLRSEPLKAQFYLELHRELMKAANAEPRPEYHSGRGTVCLQLDEDESARSHFTKAMTALADLIDFGEPKKSLEVLDIGVCHSNLLRPVNWECVMELREYMSRRWPSGDIHIGINLNWSAACGLSTDSAEARSAALELLHAHVGAPQFYGHQFTVSRLLSITPELSQKVQSAWVRRALYENAFRKNNVLDGPLFGPCS